MSIQLGIYEFFAYTIPGASYLLTVVYVMIMFGLSGFDFKALSDLSIIQVFLFTIPAYITGLITDRFATFWYRLFEPKKLAQTALDKFVANHPNFDFKFQAGDWAVLLAYIQKDKPEAIQEINKFNVVYLMLRNVSLNLIIVAGIEFVLYFHQVALNVWHLIGGLAAIVFSLIAVKQAIRYNTWFYLSNFEAILARSLTQTDLVVRKENSVKSANEKEPRKPKIAA